ncbi:MAG TPA: hypothetical protein VN765_04465 [Candidatus Acidoferrum sp.]|nr:hypothetical protein [Candidatus Acidoferrum sp.]
MNTNFSAGGVGGVGGIPPQKPAAPAAKTAAAPDAFAGSNALARAVKNLPASRPEALALARELVADPTYPSPAILRQVSSLLARSLIAALD